MSIPLNDVIKGISLKSDISSLGEPGITHTIDENVKITNDLSIGTGNKHTGTITMNNKVYTSTGHSGAHTTGGIAILDPAQHFSIFDGKELRLYNYDGTDTHSSTAFAGIKSSTETNSSGYTLTLPSGVTGKSGQYLMLSDNTGSLQWNSIAGATSPLKECKVATTGNLGYTYNNGTDAEGATLTNGSAGVITIDSQSLSLNDRILVKDQTDKEENIKTKEKEEKPLELTEEVEEKK